MLGPNQQRNIQYLFKMKAETYSAIRMHHTRFYFCSFNFMTLTQNSIWTEKRVKRGMEFTYKFKRRKY